ncbi:hypothetical protein CMUST_15660 (plasmid) [Corynebacterium mustelae]|uniref:Uncharacterized protein n=1 Tax=Corynebacterium mustelae TaxID=571915 RepID=A0A0G3H3U4_9CORY|nr:hypothetical protein [Corynebacterium mustelae]AKK05254.1 hypothetical protein CMUST_04560 [Corynebacterium mustelae]AKK07420.1 hypothetical protein CMUST_15660 [Corynebacterium mustelae]
MNEYVTAILTSPANMVIAIITAISGYLAVRQKAKADKYIARGPDWDAFAEHQKGMIDSLRLQVEDLQKLYQELKEELAAWQKKYWTAIRHIRTVHDKNPQLRDSQPIPENIADDVEL